MTYKEEFIRFMVDCGVLTFGSFTLKSGRQAPYFINTGNYKTGKQLAQLGKYYAACMKEHGLNPDTLFGPAYKGIPLATSAAVALATEYDQEVGYCFDRKEVKDHGEGGMFVGKKLADGDKVVIIEDVMTSGKAMAEVSEADRCSKGGHHRYGHHGRPDGKGIAGQSVCCSDRL